MDKDKGLHLVINIGHPDRLGLAFISVSHPIATTNALARALAL